MGNFQLFHTLIDTCWRQPYTKNRFIKDLIAGITVSIIAIPLAMALAIASGVPPQYGLYTSIVAGLVIALTGGSRFSVSGPTAAFVVILYPVSLQFGLSGLLLATILSGVFLLIMGIARLGRMIEYIPLSVTLGFTSGIAITIATMQVKDFFGLDLAQMPESYIDKIVALTQAMPSFSWADALIGVISLAVLIVWPKLRFSFPGHLPALLIGALVMVIVNQFGVDVATIGSKFSYTLADGSIGKGIPPILPQFLLPWQLPDINGNPIQWDWNMISQLVPIAFTMALLCAIESLLCAVVLDGMTDTKHHSNNELIGQGLGNIIAPFFGGISATAAIARSAANVRAGATSPIAAIIHALFVLLVLISLAPILSYLPLAAMAALLLIVAWNMSAFPRVVYLLKRAPKDDIIVLILCMSLTVLFDMVIAITIGIILASILFMRRIAKMTKINILPKYTTESTLVFRVNGPLFFAAAERIFDDLLTKSNNHSNIVLQWDAVPILDAGGLNALQNFIDNMPKEKRLLICEIPFQPLKTIAKAQMEPIKGRLSFHSTLDDALASLK